MRLVGCIRVSRVAGREGPSFISPEQQRDRILGHAAAHGHEIVAWQQDLDQPGSRMNRPGLEAALQAVERGEADGIAVAKLDRFARSVPGAAKALERLEGAGGTLVAVDLGMDTSTPAGKLMRNVLMALAEFELDRTRENWRDATARAVRRGVHVAPHVVLGYRRGDDGRLEPDPQTADVVREVFRMRGSGMPWRPIAEYLDEHAPKDGRVWSLSSVQSMIRSRTYLGETSQGALVNRHAHEPLVTRDEWERAQRRTPRPSTRLGGALLAGLIRCAACSNLMSRRSDGARGYSNYECRGRVGAGRCPEPSKLSVLRADEYVTARFLEYAAAQAVEDTPLTVDTERAIAAVEDAEAELAAYRDTTAVAVIGKAAFLEGLERRAAAVDRAREALAGLHQPQVTLAGVVDLGAAWESLTVDERRELIGAGVDAVFVRRAHLPGRAPFEGRVHICWRGEAPADLPGRASGVAAIRRFVFPNE